MRSSLRTAAFLLIATLALPPAIGAQAKPAPRPATFASPQGAAQALRAAAEAGDQAAVARIFGPEYRDLLTGDASQDAANFKRFSKDLEERLAPVKEENDQVTLEIGNRQWPFPIPLIQGKDGRWFFDTAAGKEEIVNRHIGKDELYAIGLCRAYLHDPGGHAPGPEPFHGYLFKTMPQSAGFPALVAYPQEWGRSGIFTFVAAPDGKVYRRNLDKHTAKAVAKMVQFNPDRRWDVEGELGLGSGAPAADR